MMKYVAILACMVILGMRCSGKSPSNIGVKDGKLASCPRTPNCVSSQSADREHFVEPLKYGGPLPEAVDRLLGVLGSMKRVRVVTRTERYIHAEFTSALFRFVDDAEFSFDDTAKVIHVRSASRVGRSDMGVNRKRVEEIRRRFDAGPKG